MSESDAPAADWYPDPSGRFQFRYWDGETWTGHVSTDGKTDWDPPAEAAPEQVANESGDADSAWAPHASESAQPEPAQPEPAQPEPAQPEAVEPEPAQPEAVEPEPAEPEAVQPEPAQPEPAQADVEQAEPAQPAIVQEASGQADKSEAASAETDDPSDTNLVANRRAALDQDVQAWLDEVAGQVEPRLSRISEDWTRQPQAEAARACAYGLLIGHLARIHPHMRPELGQVAEAHPSFTTLESGSRLDTLEQIAGDPSRTAAWLGALIGTEDVDRISSLFD